MQTNKHLETIEAELRFISRHANNSMEGNYDAVDEISMAVNSALRALCEYRLSLQPARDEIPADVTLPEAA